MAENALSEMDMLRIGFYEDTNEDVDITRTIRNVLDDRAGQTCTLRLIRVGEYPNPMDALRVYQHISFYTFLDEKANAECEVKITVSRGIISKEGEPIQMEYGVVKKVNGVNTFIPGRCGGRTFLAKLSMRVFGKRLPNEELIGKLMRVNQVGKGTLDPEEEKKILDNTIFPVKLGRGPEDLTIQTDSFGYKHAFYSHVDIPAKEESTEVKLDTPVKTPAPVTKGAQKKVYRFFGE